MYFIIFECVFCFDNINNRFKMQMFNLYYIIGIITIRLLHYTGKIGNNSGFVTKNINKKSLERRPVSNCIIYNC